MMTVTLDVRSPRDAMAEALAAAKSGRPQKTARISFATPELLWRVLTVKRWEILKALCGAGPMSIREVARRLGRDVKAVYADVTALLMAGIIDRLDFWGFGESGKKRDTYALKDFVSLVNQFMEQLWIASAPMVVHSMGGTVSLSVASAIPSVSTRWSLSALPSSVPP